MGTRSVAEAKARLNGILRRVEAGEKVTITRRGRPIATIVPAPVETRKSINREASEALRRTLPRSRTSTARLVRELRDAGF
jgi:prevent-host-death family protein